VDVATAAEAGTAFRPARFRTEELTPRFDGLTALSKANLTVRQVGSAPSSGRTVLSARASDRSVDGVRVEATRDIR
jgi:hypothetical protein